MMSGKTILASAQTFTGLAALPLVEVDREDGAANAILEFPGGAQTHHQVVVIMRTACAERSQDWWCIMSPYVPARQRRAGYRHLRQAHGGSGRVLMLLLLPLQLSPPVPQSSLRQMVVRRIAGRG